jgi:restriction system protein
MAQKRSLWTELHRELERHRRAVADRDRFQQQRLNQVIEDHDRAQRLAKKAESADRKRREQAAHQSGLAAASAMKVRLDARLEELTAVLTSALPSPPKLTFAALKRAADIQRFDPGGLDQPTPAPVWEEFAPATGRVSALFGGSSRRARAEQAARDAFDAAVAEHELAEAVRRRRLRTAQDDYERSVAAAEAEVREHNAAVDDLESRFRAGDPDAVEEFFTEALSLSRYPAGFPNEFQVAYRPEPRELVVERRLPPSELIPATRDFRYVKTRGQIDELARPAKEIKELYASLVYQTALRTMWECFAVSGAEDVVDAVLFNGIVTAVSKATGQPEELHLVSAPASRREFRKLILDQLDPETCLNHLKAIVSPHPYDLVPVEPVIEFEQAKYRFADPVDALAGIDARPDLLKMDWYKFENLVRQLFEAMGMEVHVTRSSRDEGIDAVAYNKTDIVHRAEILIQAKRYSACVPANDVRALAGSVEEKRATAGILVTTAWVGPDTKAFVARNNRLRVIEGGELKHLLAEHLNLDVRIQLPRKPRTAR